MMFALKFRAAIKFLASWAKKIFKATFVESGIWIIIAYTLLVGTLIGGIHTGITVAHNTPDILNYPVEEIMPLVVEALTPLIIGGWRVILIVMIGVNLICVAISFLPPMRKRDPEQTEE